MKLADLEKYSDIVIQCHDIPDADAIGSGYALFRYLQSKRKNVALVYSGSAEISKINLQLMIRKLGIPLLHVDENYPVKELLITVDCQYGSRNVTRLNAPKIGIIDHHQEDPHVKELKTEFCHILGNYGSCASVLYQLFLLSSLNSEKGSEEQRFLHDRNVNTALLYGLYMDTNEFSEITHPADRDLRNITEYSFDIFRSLKSSNFNIDELEVISKALTSIRFYQEDNFAILNAQDCDPNILGYISDLCNRTCELNSCVVYMKLPDGYKISVRSCSKEIKANELAGAICRGVGNGGGHIQKAGGKIFTADLERQGSSSDICEFIYRRYREFYCQSDYIHVSDFDFSTVKQNFELYAKRKIVLGFVPSEALRDFASELRIETLEGKTELAVSHDTLIMCGIKGELYPITREKFEQRYSVCNHRLDINFDYEPRVYNTANNEIRLIRDYIIPCTVRGTSNIFARKLARTTKIIYSERTAAENGYRYQNFLTGLSGDYLAVSENNTKDLYAISSDVFDTIYQKVE